MLDPKESEIYEGGSHRDTTMITEDNEVGKHMPVKLGWGQDQEGLCSLQVNL
jgi:hypothetical protein